MILNKIVVNWIFPHFLNQLTNLVNWGFPLFSKSTKILQCGDESDQTIISASLFEFTKIFIFIFFLNERAPSRACFIDIEEERQHKAEQEPAEKLRNYSLVKGC
jgi:hypothetical protein